MIWAQRRRTTPTEPPTVPEGAAQAWEAIKLVNDWVKHAETKAAATLAAAGIVAGALWRLVDLRSFESWWYRAPVVLAAAMALASVLTCLAALWPRLRSREPATSLLYFDHIARRHPDTPSGYVRELGSLLSSPEQLVEQIGQQVWANAGVARRKYFWAGLGLIALAGAIVGLGGAALYVSLVSIGAVSGR